MRMPLLTLLLACGLVGMATFPTSAHAKPTKHSTHHATVAKSPATVAHHARAVHGHAVKARHGSHAKAKSSHGVPMSLMIDRHAVPGEMPNDPQSHSSYLSSRARQGSEDFQSHVAMRHRNGQSLYLPTTEDPEKMTSDFDKLGTHPTMADQFRAGALEGQYGLAANTESEEPAPTRMPVRRAEPVVRHPRAEFSDLSPAAMPSSAPTAPPTPPGVTAKAMPVAPSVPTAEMAEPPSTDASMSQASPMAADGRIPGQAKSSGAPVGY